MCRQFPSSTLIRTNFLSFWNLLINICLCIKLLWFAKIVGIDGFIRVSSVQLHEWSNRRRKLITTPVNGLTGPTILNRSDLPKQSVFNRFIRVLTIQLHVRSNRQPKPVTTPVHSRTGWSYPVFKTIPCFKHLLYLPT